MNTKDEKNGKAKATEEKKEEKTNVVPMPKAEPVKVDEIKKMLDVQIHKFEQLSMKIAHREKFLTTQTRLSLYSDSLEKEKTKGNPETDVFYIKLCSKLTYKEDEAISVNNIDLIEEFLKFINVKISLKVAELEKEIIM